MQVFACLIVIFPSGPLKVSCTGFSIELVCTLSRTSVCEVIVSTDIIKVWADETGMNRQSCFREKCWPRSRPSFSLCCLLPFLMSNSTEIQF